MITTDSAFSDFQDSMSSVITTIVELNEPSPDTEMITDADDRTFDSDTGNWQNGTLLAFTVGSGHLAVACDGTSQFGLLATAGFTGFVKDREYRITYDSTGTANQFRWQTGGANQIIGSLANGTGLTVDFYCKQSSVQLLLVSLVGSGNTNIDNVSIFEKAGKVWYLANRAITLTDGPVYKLLSNHNGISESINIYTRQWTTPDVTVTISNQRYRKDIDDGSWVRLGDEIGGVRYNVAKIYLAVGPNITSLSQCVQRFSGWVVHPPVISDTAVSIRLSPLGNYALQKNVPRNLVSDSFSGPLRVVDNLNIKKPLVLGVFNWLPQNLSESVGLARCVDVQVDTSQNPLLLVSDHVLNTIDELGYSVYSDFSQPIQRHSHATATADNGGLGMLIWNNAVGGDYTAHYAVHAFPGPLNLGTYTFAGETTPTNYNNVRDDNSATFATAIDNSFDIGSASQGRMNFSFLDEGSSPFQVYLGGMLTKLDDTHTHEFWQKTTTSDFTILDSINKRELQLHIAGGSSILRSAYPVGPRTLWSTDSRWQGTIDGPSAPFIFPLFNRSSDTTPYVVSYVMQDSTADGVIDNQNIMEFHGAYVKVGTTYLDTSVISGPSDYFASCKGISYDSTITGRSSNYSDGDVIEDPSGIIEYLIRNEMFDLTGGAITDSDIDETSFIAAENTSVKSRINITDDNQDSLINVIRQITEQSTFVFLWSATGQATLIDMSDKTPTTARTIPYSHITNGRIGVTKTTEVVNELNIKSRWRAEYDKYADSDTISDTTSQETFGVAVYNAIWANIATASKDHVAALLVNSTDGIWSKEHDAISFETALFMNADLEVGDHIELDATSVDPHLKIFGESWEGKQFLITDIRQTTTSTRIKGIQLF